MSLSENALNKAVARSHQTLASVEDQDPHGEHINSKSVWHALTSSLLPFIHAPHLHIYQKGPLWLSPLSANPSPWPHQHTPVQLRKSKRAGNMCWLGTRMHMKMIHKYTQMHKINSFFVCLFAEAVYKCATA